MALGMRQNTNSMTDSNSLLNCHNCHKTLQHCWAL